MGKVDYDSEIIMAFYTESTLEQVIPQYFAFFINCHRNSCGRSVEEHSCRCTSEQPPNARFLENVICSVEKTSVHQRTISSASQIRSLDLKSEFGDIQRIRDIRCYRTCSSRTSHKRIKERNQDEESTHHTRFWEKLKSSDLGEDCRRLVNPFN